MYHQPFSPPATVTNSAAALFSSPSAHPSTSHHQPAEVFRKDLISAMKLPDNHQLHPQNYMVITDTWKMEWEKGVQVPVDPHAIPNVVITSKESEHGSFKLPKKHIRFGGSGPNEEPTDFDRSLQEICQYDMDDMDLHWLQLINKERLEIGDDVIDESELEQVIEEIEAQCHKNMEHVMATEEGLGIEFDEDVICDVCRAPECEEGNEMVFCDNCDICVHQACYGIVKIPEGNWMCRTCALGIQPMCLLCGIKGGAMKSTRSGTKWAHVSCALWIPEVSIGCVERMEPITKISQIPASRWALICKLCRVRTGACIQCSVKTCKIAYHVTCGFENNLEMKTFLDDNTEVRFKSYCLKHSKKKPIEGPLGPNTVDVTPQKSPHSTPKKDFKEKTNEEKANERAMKIQYVTEEFYKYVKAKDVVVAMDMKEDPTDKVDQIYEYWKLKRKAGFNRPLVVSQKEVAHITGNEEYNLHARMRMFVHLRQDLERVRNLCYMVQRREKLSKQMGTTRQAIFYKQCELFNGDISQYSQAELSWALRAIEISSGNSKQGTDNQNTAESGGAALRVKVEPNDDESDSSSSSSGSRDSSPDSSSRSGSSAHSGDDRNSRESSPHSKSSRGAEEGRGKDNNNPGGDSNRGGNNVEACPNEDAVDNMPTLNEATNCLAQNNNNNLVSLRHRNNGSRNVKRKLSMDKDALPVAKRRNDGKNGTFKSDYAKQFEDYLKSVANIEPKRTTRQTASTITSDTEKTHNTRHSRQETTLREMQLIEEADKVHAQLTGKSPDPRKRFSNDKSDSDSELICVSPPRQRNLGLAHFNAVTPTPQEDERSCQSTPETRSARRRIEEELDRDSECSDRQFENIDAEISMCLDSNENAKDERKSPLASPLVSRITRQSRLTRKSRLALRSENVQVKDNQVSSLSHENSDGGGESRKYGIRSRLTDVALRMLNSSVGL